jgi:peptidoglycan-associated lipoprotein
MAQHPDVRIQLEGHCDERGTVAYNLALGERRANVVRQYMTALGVSDARMTTISYGEEFPLDPGHDEAAWARNRRAHFAILNP